MGEQRQGDLAVVDGWTQTDKGFVKDDWIVSGRPGEEALALLYMRMKQDGTLKLLFHQSDCPLVEWLRWLSDPSIVVWGLYKQRPTSDGLYDLHGLGFVNFIHQIPGVKKAEVGFTFAADCPMNVFGRAAVVRRMIDLTFLETDIDVMFGTTPERNPGAVALLKRVGLRLFGPVPKYCSWHGDPCGAWISEVDRETWFNLSR